MNKLLLIALMSISVSSCSTRPINDGKEMSLEELSFEFQKQLDRHDVELPVTTEYFSEYGMYIIRVTGSKYFKDDASISIDPEQVQEFDEIVLRIKRAMKIIDDTGGGPIGSINFAMVYHDRKEFSRRNKAYWDEKDSLKKN